MVKGHRRLTPEDRAHLQHLEQWSKETRVAMQQVRASKFWPAIQRAAGIAVDQDPILDNVDWLIAALKKLDQPTASDLLRAVERYKQERSNG